MPHNTIEKRLAYQRSPARRAAEKKRAMERYARGLGRRTKQQNKESYLRHKEKQLAYQKERFKIAKNIEWRRRYEKNKLINSPDFKIKKNLKHRVWHAITSKNLSKSNGTFGLLGCSIEHFKNHIQSLFKPGMAWNNYGYDGWHIDHIKPCAAFDLTKPEEQAACFHYSNMQPLWKRENFSKGAKYQEQKEQHSI